MTQQWDFPVDEPVSLPTYRRRRPDQEIETIATLLREGTSIRTVAGEYGVSRESIRRSLSRAGTPRVTERQPQPYSPPRRVRANRLSGRGRSRALTTAEVSELLCRHSSGESIRALARAVGVSHETVRRALHEATSIVSYVVSA